ncbi:undecaprenyl diphosphate synthase family protein [Caldisphaera sp.]|jgi:undecaprenyl pyrophosphate synthase|uniref:undecaprenyl diphosphate synthase family protein n=1 Tax=Caldisphaera sp. TaxID=2060322 RepID=UPI00397A0DBA
MKTISLPIHIGIIPDGNRRWAKKNKIDFFTAYKIGFENLKKILDKIVDYGIYNASVYVLSYENCTRRSKTELNFLFYLSKEGFNYIRENQKLKDNDISVRVIGDMSIVPDYILNEIKKTEEETKNRKNGILNLAYCYSGEWELNLIKNGEKPPSLYMKPIDLLIRTGGVKRISGFFPLLINYAEFYFTDILWPDFNEIELEKSLNWFSSQPRNFGI